MNSTDFQHSNLTLAFLIAVSIFGLLLSTFFVFHSFTLDDELSYRKLLAGTSYGILCILGMSATLFPYYCSMVPKFEKRNKQKIMVPPLHESAFQAHHPPCDSYSAHIINIRKKKFCATCSGLLVGATFVLLGTSLYFFAGYRLGNPFILFLIGITGVTLGFAQSALPKFSVGSTRFFASILFVVGTFMILVSIDDIVKNISVDLFLVVLCALWILTKIALSQRDHQQTCSQCLKESCPTKKL